MLAVIVIPFFIAGMAVGSALTLGAVYRRQIADFFRENILRRRNSI